MCLTRLQLAVGRKKKGAKSRAFSVQLLGYLLADSLWESKRTGGALQPVWVAYLGTDQECRAFTANFRAGRAADAGSDRFQLPKKAPHRWVVQRVPDASITVGYLPELFHLDPAGPVGEQVAFVFAPPRAWIDEQAALLEADFGDEAPEVARAALFAAYLDRRTRLPLVHDLRFHLQLFRAALEADWLSEPAASAYSGGVLVADGAAACGLDRPIACSVAQDELAEFLVVQTSHFHREEIRRGKTRIASDRRVLPYPDGAASQIRLDFAVA
jgi:hypothetical protein